MNLDAEVPRPPPARTSGGSGSRGPRGPPRGGPRSGGSRMSGGQDGSRGGPQRRGRRTQEDLDKELDDFMRGPVPAETEEGATMDEEMAID